MTPEEIIEQCEREKDRLRDAEQKRANDRRGLCPQCGAPLHVRLIETTSFSGPPSWLPGYATCDTCRWTDNPYTQYERTR